MVEVSQSPSGYAPALVQRGSLASSQAMIVGSSLYLTPVIELVRFMSVEIQSLNQPLICASV